LLSSFQALEHEILIEYLAFVTVQYSAAAIANGISLEWMSGAQLKR
jgi:hypothetical protein